MYKPKIQDKDTDTCNHFETCSAPLCPQDRDSLLKGVWFPDEEICRNRKFTGQTFIRKERAIKKKAKDETTYYTNAMLNRDITIRKGISGIDPDQEINQAELAESQWIKAHPEKKSPSPESLKAKKEMMRRVREARSKKPAYLTQRNTQNEPHNQGE